MSGKKAPNPLAAKRHKARHYAMQALYQWRMAGTAPDRIEAEFRGDYDFGKVDGAYFHELLHNIRADIEAIDSLFAPCLVERTPSELDPVEQALLRIGTYELKTRLDVPYKVVINEAVNLARKFGATDGHKFINGVLDRLARQLRSSEVNAAPAD